MTAADLTDEERALWLAEVEQLKGSPDAEKLAWRYIERHRRAIAELHGPRRPYVIRSFVARKMAYRPPPTNLADLAQACIAKAATIELDEPLRPKQGWEARHRTAWAAIALAVAVSNKHASAALGKPAHYCSWCRENHRNLIRTAEPFGKTLRPVYDETLNLQSTENRS